MTVRKGALPRVKTVGTGGKKEGLFLFEVLPLRLFPKAFGKVPKGEEL